MTTTAKPPTITAILPLDLGQCKAVVDGFRGEVQPEGEVNSPSSFRVDTIAPPLRGAARLSKPTRLRKSTCRSAPSRAALAAADYLRSSENGQPLLTELICCDSKSAQVIGRGARAAQQ